MCEYTPPRDISKFFCKNCHIYTNKRLFSITFANKIVNFCNQQL